MHIHAYAHKHHLQLLDCWTVLRLKRHHEFYQGISLEYVSVDDYAQVLRLLQHVTYMYRYICGVYICTTKFRPVKKCVGSLSFERGKQKSVVGWGDKETSWHKLPSTGSSQMSSNRMDPAPQMSTLAAKRKEAEEAKT